MHGIANQVGLSIFHFDKNSFAYEVFPYTFYVCPRSLATIDDRFVCQASCLQFLTRNNFDFDEIGVQCTSEYIRYNAHVSGKAGTLGGTRLGTWCHRQLHEQDIWSHAEAENTCMCGDKTGVL